MNPSIQAIVEIVIVDDLLQLWDFHGDLGDFLELVVHAVDFGHMDDHCGVVQV